MGRVKRIWYLSPIWAAKVQASLHIRAVSPEPPLLAHTSSESRGTFRQKAKSLAPMNGWACAVKICHDGMLEDTNSLDAVHMVWVMLFSSMSAVWTFLVWESPLHIFKYKIHSVQTNKCITNITMADHEHRTGPYRLLHSDVSLLAHRCKFVSLFIFVQDVCLFLCVHWKARYTLWHFVSFSLNICWDYVNT